MVTFLAIAGNIYQNIAIQKISLVLPTASASESLDLTTGTSSAAYRVLSIIEQEAIIPQIMAAMSNVWLFFMVAAALSFVLSFVLLVSFRTNILAVQQVQNYEALTFRRKRELAVEVVPEQQLLITRLLTNNAWLHGYAGHIRAS